MPFERKWVLSIELYLGSELSIGKTAGMSLSIGISVVFFCVKVFVSVHFCQSDAVFECFSRKLI